MPTMNYHAIAIDILEFNQRCSVKKNVQHTEFNKWMQKFSFFILITISRMKHSDFISNLRKKKKNDAYDR